MTPATFTVSVKHYLRGFESESVEITLADIPANIDMAELDAINERAGRVAQALTVQIRTGEPPKPVIQAAPQAVNNSIFDDDDIRVPGSTDVSGQALAAPHAPENSAGGSPATDRMFPSAGQPSGVSPDAGKSPEPAPSAPERENEPRAPEGTVQVPGEYDPHADTDEIRPETLAAIAAEEKPAKKSRDSETSPFSLMRPEGHPEYCRCGECFDPFHDDAPKYDDAAHPAGCACLKCNPIKCALCGKLKTPEVTFVHIAKLGNVYNCLTCYQGGTEEKRSQPEFEVKSEKLGPELSKSFLTDGHVLDGQGTCTICGGNKTAGSLTTECCKRTLGAVEAGMVVNGKLDFKNQRWGDPSSEPKEAPKDTPVPCHRCAEPVFGGGVTVAGNVYCHECNREKDKSIDVSPCDGRESCLICGTKAGEPCPNVRRASIDVAPEDIPLSEPKHEWVSDALITSQVPTQAAADRAAEIGLTQSVVDIPEDVKTTIDAFGIEVPIPPIEWAAEPMTKSGGESDGGQCKALNTVLGEFGYKGGDRHYATLAIIAHFNPMRVQLDSLDKLTRAEAHFALEWLDRAKGNEDAAIALHVDASARKGQIPLFNPKVKESAAA